MMATHGENDGIQGNASQFATHKDGAISKGLPRFTLDIPDALPSPVLIAAPHAGRNYPPDLLASMRNPDFAAIRLEDRLVDLLAREVARQTGAALLVADAPRALIDLNRAPGDMDWGMVAEGRPANVSHSAANRRARGGLGLIPRRLNGLGEIWRERISHAEVQRRISQVHEPYHAALKSTLDRIRSRWGAALLIDLHSMPPLKPRRPTDRPAQYVLGDRFGASCNGMLSATAMRYFGRVGARAAHNRPYAGGYVLDRHGAPSVGVHAMQIEVCRSLYLERDHAVPSARAGEIAGVLTGLVRALAEEVVPRRSWPQAAE
ncbi:N-formylglutamate amidohydrolase [Qipengyuania sp. DSG2-2]|uniref:N-formylglutamate amidohydrolase n=1 Tax=Qipengyuania sp. DGS2-2 TaxID=3349631 RepID=UPI0036D30598